MKRKPWFAGDEGGTPMAESRNGWRKQDSECYR